MDPSLGARLKAQRERQQVSLNAISDATKIKLSILEGLERDDVSQWPDGIYRRAYVRAYARAVGLDPDALVREFLTVHPDPIVAPPEAEPELEEPAWPAGIRRLVTSAISAIPPRRQRDERDRADSRGDGNRLAPQDPKAPMASRPGAASLDGADRVSTPASSPSPATDEGRDSGPRPTEPGLQDAAALCTRLVRVVDSKELAPILEDAARACDAVGVIVWSWDARAEALRPVLAHGYTDAILARLPLVQPGADNAIASAFRLDRPCIVNGGDGLTGALAVPLASQHGCVGVLAMELRNGGEQRPAVGDFAAILAAQLAARLGPVPLAEAVNS